MFDCQIVDVYDFEVVEFYFVYFVGCFEVFQGEFQIFWCESGYEDFFVVLMLKMFEMGILVISFDVVVKWFGM